MERHDLEIAYSQLRSNLNQELPVIEELETYFANWNDSKIALTFINARSALDVIIRALEIEEGSEVILSPYCCVAVPNAFTIRGINPVFVDIEPDSLSLDAERVLEAITPSTKAVVVPHIMGLVARDLEKIQAICQEKNIYLIEDCAQAMGAQLKRIKVGNFGDAAIFSTEKSKVVSSVTGGFAVTNNEELALKLKAIQEAAPFPDLEVSHQIMKTAIGLCKKLKGFLPGIKRPWIRTFWQPHFFSMPEGCANSADEPPLYGYRMDSLTASLLYYQVRKLNGVLRLRIATAKKWRKRLEKEKEIEFFSPAPDSFPIYCRYPFKVVASVKESGKYDTYKGYRIGKWYSGLLDPCDAKLEGFPVATEMTKRVLNLPTILR